MRTVSPSGGACPELTVAAPSTHATSQPPPKKRPHASSIRSRGGSKKGNSPQFLMDPNAPSGEGEPKPRSHGRRVRGMSAVQKFEQEYITKDFLTDFNAKQEKKIKEGKSGKAPLPYGVDMWAQVSRMKEEALVLKESEAGLVRQVSDLDATLRDMTFHVSQQNLQVLRDLEFTERSGRESIIACWHEIAKTTISLMHRCEPENAPLPDNKGLAVCFFTLQHLATTRASKEKKTTNKRVKYTHTHTTLLQGIASTGSEGSDLAEQLIFEVKRRQELEEVLQAEGGDKMATVLEQLGALRRQAAEQAEKALRLEEQVLQKDKQVAALAGEKAQYFSNVSKVETELLVLEGTKRRMQAEIDTLRASSFNRDDELIRLQEESASYRARLSDAKERLHIEIEKNEQFKEMTLQRTSILKTTEPIAHTVSKQRPLTAVPVSPRSPRRISLSPRANKAY